MLDIGKVTAFAVIAALCAVTVRKQAQELAMVLILAAVTGILISCIGLFGAIRDLLDRLIEATGLSPAVAAPVIKTVGISVLTRFGSEVCKDAREGGLATAVEIAGTAAALCLAAPLLQMVLDLITELT